MASASLVGAQTIKTLCSFNGTNGANPYAALTLGNDGNFYGTTYYGGITNSTYTNGMGTVFKVTTNGTLTTLVSFMNFANGVNPTATLTLGTDGNFYGTTYYGGSGYDGTVFKVTTNGTLITLVSFNGRNGAFPYAGLTLGNNGNFYGTTYEGGTYGDGTVFKVTTNGTLTVLVIFCGSSGYNGALPQAALTLGNDGNFYGTTESGGSYGDTYDDGTVFKMTTNGVLTTLVIFYGSNGAYPGASALTLGNDGNFYGTVGEDSGSDYKTVFKMTTNGVLTTLAYLSYVNGAGPVATLTLGTDGNFYGTTMDGGRGDSGTVFMVTTNGTLTTLVSFSYVNGAYLSAALTLGTDGNFYGTTRYGGIANSLNPSGMGTVFRLLLPPVITVQPRSQTNNAGATVTLLVSATSLIPLGYQWQKNSTNLVDGGNISGSSTTTLTITGISDSDAATYSVIVSNANFSVTNYATLTVIDPPTLALQFVSGYPQLNLAGTLGNNFVVQYSTNLASTNWVNLLSMTNLSSSPYLFLDPTGVGQPARFYRAFMQ